MTEKKPRYLSYLLRLWETGDDREQIWRASLESPGSGKRRGFADLQELFDFLYEQIAQAGPTLHETHCHGKETRDENEEKTHSRR